MQFRDLPEHKKKYLAAYRAHYKINTPDDLYRHLNQTLSAVTLKEIQNAVAIRQSDKEAIFDLFYMLEQIAYNKGNA